MKEGNEKNIDMRDLYTDDPSKWTIFHYFELTIIFVTDKIDLINNLSSIKLLQISEHFEMLP